jgi:dolichyl-phosphate beta-glucosyltransferase
MPPQLSVVIPAYNEAARIGPYLDEIRSYLAAAYPRDHEVVVVDDGSTDDTADLVHTAAAQWPRLRLVQHAVNRGKGAAVRTGVRESLGRTILFADADGATPIAEERRLSLAMARGAAVAVGSRHIPGPGITRDRNLRRALAGSLFAWTARTLVGVGVKDTQCGFKMFDGAVGRMLFDAGAETGYLFDIEVLALARRWGYEVAEVPVNWSEREGSKVRFVRDSMRMFTGLWRLQSQLRLQPEMRVPDVGEQRRAA